VKNPCFGRTLFEAPGGRGKRKRKTGEKGGGFYGKEGKSRKELGGRENVEKIPCILGGRRRIERPGKTRGPRGLLIKEKIPGTNGDHKFLKGDRLA